MKTFSLQKTLASRLIFSIALIGILSILTNCGGGGGGSTNDNNQNNNLTAGQAALSGTVQPDPSSPTPADGQNAGATVYVVGQPNNTATTDGSGNFNLTIDATLSGTVLSGRSFKRTDPATKTYELIVISGAKGHGRKVEVPVVAGVVNPLSTIYINTVGSISGKAYLQGQTDHTGIRVYIPGTSFQANTDAAGNYTISNVPSGTYDLVRADYPGTVYHYAIVANVTVTTNQTVTLPDMLLQTSVGASGSVLINSGDAFTTSTSVKLSIAPSDNAVLMAISEDPTFSGTLTWEPVKSTRDYTFAGAYSPGATATIYVKFADMSGLPTAGSASDSIYIDTNPLATKDAPGTPISNTKPTLQWHYTPPMPSPTYHVQLATDTGFVHIVAGQDQTGLTPAQWTVSTALNQGFYYWRVAIIDSTGHQWNWSGPWSFEINLYTVTLTAPTDTSFTNNATPTFTWTANTNAATYNFVLSANADLSSPLFNTTDIVGTSYPLPASPALTDGTFYWAVTPVDGNGISGTRSAIQSFTLDTVAPSGMNIGTCTDHAGGNCTGIMITSNNAPLITGLNYSTGPTATVPIHASDSNGVASYCMKTGFSGSTTTCPGTPCPSGNWISTGSDPLPTDYVTALSTQLSVGNPWPIL